MSVKVIAVPKPNLISVCTCCGAIQVCGEEDAIPSEHGKAVRCGNCKLVFNPCHETSSQVGKEISLLADKILKGEENS